MPSPTLVPRIGPARLARAIGREAALVALSLVVGALSFGAMLTFVDEAGATGIRIELLLLLDAAAGLLGIAILPLRRFAPLAVAAVLGVIAAVSSIGLFASGIALVSLAIRRRPKEIAAAAAVWIAAVGTWEVAGLSYLPVTPEELPLTAALILVVLGLLILLGLYLGGRRELLASLRERARLAEEEQALRSAQAADRERTRIAREMHDVLAHRLSLVALHAGALEYRDDLDAAEVRATAGVVRDNARTALTELRGVLGVLRDPSGAPATLPPQPTLADLPALLDEARALGVEVHADVDPGTRDDLPRLPATTSRHAYRAVQECLTNARRHAPGAPVEVSLDGRPGGRLRIVVRNPAPPPAASEPPASTRGHGLAGIAERAHAVDGTLDVSRRDGQHIVEAVLPWTA
ncbi:histidine kinase [Clavibacter michiganensis]|uniref:sensor histidine kinase n=2 Tax=Clavibacter michiganensis TaxID=28447 RepID=UPI00136569AF|nr:histidine kinase [Clavibacter michiganensis]MDO4025359.1 histidine kinase [Clavibacter michiganensis]MDO4035124.1 histidine kinase [Clavibacter michiganensis]MDO4041741.1 histidine kinase [Clavibacter michiganensis]MDO4047124.1 histidine kinase [Clavibacter michiganensis]MDO4059565.1 histidine kinase [Clavibacter michiganensis]